MTRRTAATTLAVALLLGGAPGPATAGTTVAPNVQISEPADFSLDAHNSPAIAVNPQDPDNLVEADKVDRPDFTCGFRVSFDGGETWEDVSVEMPSEPEGKCYAPQPAFASDGTAYVIFAILTGRGNRPEAIFLARSTNGGLTFTDPRAVLGEESFQVSLTVVGTDLYLTWLHGNPTSIVTLGLGAPPNPILMQVSRDGGETFGPPTQVGAGTFSVVNDPKRVFVTGPTVAVTPDRTINVAYYDLQGDLWNYEGVPQATPREPPARPPYAVALARSTDGGETFTHHAVDPFVDPLGNFLIYISPKPAITASGGRLHVAWTAGRRGDQRVFAATSSDGGDTWSTQELPGPDADEHTPWLDTAPSGRVDLVYYSRQRDPADPEADTDVLAVSSFDGGATWSDPLRLSDVSFDGDLGPHNVIGKADLGNRLALVSDDDGFFAAWADTRLSDSATQRQDVFGTRVTLAPG